MIRRFILLLFLLINSLYFAKVEIAAYPSGGYANDTGFYAGGLAYLRYRPAAFETSTPKNIFYLSSSYSEKKQFNVFFQPVIHFENGLYRLESELQYKKWPSDFYGIGMQADRNDFESFTPIEKSLKTSFVKKLNRSWEIALYYQVMQFEIRKKETGGILDSGTIVGSKDSITSGLGCSLRLDSRNVVSFPTNGSLFRLQINSFSPLIASDYHFTQLILDLRQYFQLNQINTIALQSYFSSLGGEVPFFQMNHLDENMRAITSHLFIDKNVFVLRAEDRIFLWESGFMQRLGLAVFAEMGEVAENIELFNLTDLQFNYGFGFRYSFFLEDRLNLRLDIGFGEVKANISIASGEVF